ncbi:MAG: hypothetical protein ACFFCZ_20265 [Promethearchaeota archaeon]
MFIDDYEAIIKLNGTKIHDWSSFSVYDKLGISETQFDIELLRPIEVASNSTISISDGIDGSHFPLVDSKDVEYVSGSVNHTIIRGIGSSLTRYAPVKNIFYINKTWLDLLGTNYTLQNGIIYSLNTMQGDIKSHGVSVNRLFLQGLPGKNLRDAEIECVLFPGITYHDIIEDLFSRIGYTVNIDLPNLDVQKTLVISAGTPYFSAIVQLYGNWNPIIKVEGTVVNILDYGGNRQARTSGSGVYSLSEDSFSVYNWDRSSIDETVDHVVVNGPSVAWTYKGFKSHNIGKTELSPIDLIGEDATYVTETEFKRDPEYLEQYLGRIKKDLSFEYSNLIDAENSKSLRIVKTKINSDTDEEAVIEEETRLYDSNDNLMSKVIIKKFYYDYNTPVGTRIEEYGRYAKLNIGQTNQYNGNYLTYIPNEYVFDLVTLIEEKYGTFVGDTGMVETTKKIYKRCLSYEETVKNDDGTFKVLQTPYPVEIIGQIGISTFEEVDEEDADASRWREDLIPYQDEEVRLNFLSDSLLMKSRFITKYVPMKTTYTIHEDVPLKRRQTFRDYVERRWEFFYINGYATPWDSEEPPEGDFHAKIEIYEPDVIDGLVAQQIADRFFVSKKANNTTASIRTTTPIWGLKVGSTIKLPSCTKKVFDWAGRTFDTVTIDENYFWVVGRRRVSRFTGEIGESQRKVDVYDELELKEYF